MFKMQRKKEEVEVETETRNKHLLEHYYSPGANNPRPNLQMPVLVNKALLAQGLIHSVVALSMHILAY